MPCLCPNPICGLHLEDRTTVGCGAHNPLPIGGSSFLNPGWSDTEEPHDKEGTGYLDPYPIKGSPSSSPRLFLVRSSFPQAERRGHGLRPGHRRRHVPQRMGSALRQLLHQEGESSARRDAMPMGKPGKNVRKSAMRYVLRTQF
ncbi:hypothetical protein MUK42_01303 [Musa troglodytarum]|uniref:Uncharacterized protein n=1 Tax=Musa troglodytarum TaxID=320322 RepID=A0A9E7FDM8_9LILI|nr:hypothetical protein MUK42_01303 [Musa troglodytarum]URD94014.1 hypothetical protein MUK42_01303 [Musa troglodytarum]